MNTVHDNGNDLREIENIYPSNIRKRELHSSSRTYYLTETKRMAYELCRGCIDPGYIKHSFNKFKEGILYYRGSMEYAFSLWKVRTNMRPDGANFKDLHINLLCARKSDFPFLGLILHDIEQKCLTEGIPYITLYPADTTLREHYKKYGFVENHPRFDSDTMTKVIELPISLTASRRNLRGRTRRARRASSF